MLTEVIYLQRKDVVSNYEQIMVLQTERAYQFEDIFFEPVRLRTNETFVPEIQRKLTNMRIVRKEGRR